MAEAYLTKDEIAAGETTHWSDAKEQIHSSKPLKILLFLFRWTPGFLVRALIYPVGFFYLLFSTRGRHEARRYQTQLKEYTGGKSPCLISPYRQIVSFCLCVLEKMEGWLGIIKYNRIEYQDDDIGKILGLLKEGKGAFLITSHLGNMELMRSLSDYNTQLVSREVPVYVIMEMGTTQTFNQTLKELNPKFQMNVIDSAKIGMNTISDISDAIEKGGLVVIAGDRTPAHSQDRVLTQKFLGKEAHFPYGAFLIPALIKKPVFYMFGMRSRTSIFNPKQRIYIEESKVDFNVGRAQREEKIRESCAEFVGKLEKFCISYPYQWYNFHNFWNLEE